MRRQGEEVSLSAQAKMYREKKGKMMSSQQRLPSTQKTAVRSRKQPWESTTSTKRGVTFVPIRQTPQGTRVKALSHMGRLPRSSDKRGEPEEHGNLRSKREFIKALWSDKIRDDDDVESLYSDKSDEDLLRRIPNSLIQDSLNGSSQGFFDTYARRYERLPVDKFTTKIEEISSLLDSQKLARRVPEVVFRGTPSWHDIERVEKDLALKEAELEERSKRLIEELYTVQDARTVLFNKVPRNLSCSFDLQSRKPSIKLKFLNKLISEHKVGFSPGERRASACVSIQSAWRSALAKQHVSVLRKYRGMPAAAKKGLERISALQPKSMGLPILTAQDGNISFEKLPELAAVMKSLESFDFTLAKSPSQPLSPTQKKLRDQFRRELESRAMEKDAATRLQTTFRAHNARERLKQKKQYKEDWQRFWQEEEAESKRAGEVDGTGDYYQSTNEMHKENLVEDFAGFNADELIGEQNYYLEHEDEADMYDIEKLGSALFAEYESLYDALGQKQFFYDAIMSEYDGPGEAELEEHAKVDTTIAGHYGQHFGNVEDAVNMTFDLDVDHPTKQDEYFETPWPATQEDLGIKSRWEEFDVEDDTQYIDIEDQPHVQIENVDTVDGTQLYHEETPVGYSGEERKEDEEGPMKEENEIIEGQEYQEEIDENQNNHDFEEHREIYEYQDIETAGTAETEPNENQYGSRPGSSATNDIATINLGIEAADFEYANDFEVPNSPNVDVGEGGEQQNWEALAFGDNTVPTSEQENQMNGALRVNTTDAELYGSFGSGLLSPSSPKSSQAVVDAMGSLENVGYLNIALVNANEVVGTSVKMIRSDGTFDDVEVLDVLEEKGKIRCKCNDGRIVLKKKKYFYCIPPELTKLAQEGSSFYEEVVKNCKAKVGDWEICFDSDGREFYYNVPHNKSVWQRPPELDNWEEEVLE